MCIRDRLNDNANNVVEFSKDSMDAISALNDSFTECVKAVSYTHLVTVRDRKDLGKIIKMAFHIARTGKPGPVLIDLPKDIQTASGPAEYPDKVKSEAIV